MLLDLDSIFDPDRTAPAVRGPAALPPESRELWEERAGIMEFDGGMKRDAAERAALAEIQKVQWFERRRG